MQYSFLSECSSEPEALLLTQEELLLRSNDSVTIVVLNKTAPRTADLKQNTLFRSLLPDGVTMLELLGNEEPRIDSVFRAQKPLKAFQ